MKKITALLLSIAMITSLSACGEKKEETASTTETTTITTKATTKATTKETVPETTENVYELNYTYKFDDCVSIKINKNWDMDEKENISSFYIPVNNGLVIAKSTFEDFSDSTLVLFAEELKSNGDIEDYKFIEIDEHNAITYENLGENTITYQFAVDTTVYNILLGNSLDSNLIDSMLDSIQILETNVAETEKITNKKTEEKSEEKVPVYQNNMYKVGTDIDAGEYMLFAESDIGGYVCVSSDANQDDIIYNENFGNNLIATFEDGEYVDLSRCFAIPYDKVTADISKLIKAYIDEGAMYKVGTNLEAGEYKLETTDDYGGYYCIYSDSRHDYIIANDNFDNNTYVSVSDGEYLLLSRCKIIE